MIQIHEKQSIRLSDCTLRDTAHAPFVTLDQKRAIQISQALNRLSLDEIEVGIPLASIEDKSLVEALVDQKLNAKIVTFYINRRISKLEDDLKRIRDLGVYGVAISTPVSEEHARLKLDSSKPSFITKLMSKAVSTAKSLGLYVCFTGEDSARTDFNFLKAYVKAGEEAGANRFRFAESVSALQPHQVEGIIGELVAHVDIDIECHCHNMYGLAVANTLAAYRSGATWLSGTINGHGERGGNASLNEILLILRDMYGIDRFQTRYLFETAQIVANACQLEIPKDRGIIGKYSFAYELGNQIEHPESYEPFDPISVGHRRYTIIGKKADRYGIKRAASDHQAQLSSEQLEALRQNFLECYREKKAYYESNQFIQRFLG